MADDDKTDSREEGLRNLLQRHNNDWAALAAELYSQTFKLRDDRRDARARITELEKQIPGEDALVLKGEDRTMYESYKALGKPDEIKQRFDAAARSVREAAVTRMASHHGFKDSVLNRLLGDGAEIIVEGSDDKPVYKVKNGETTKTVDELLKAEWADFVPALATEKQTGTKAAGQAGSERETGDTDYVKSYLEAQQPKAQAS